MDEVKRLRLEMGWSQNELAYHAKLAPSVISLIETGKRDPNATTLRKLAEALEVRIPDLFEESGSGKAPRRSSLEPSLFNGVEEERQNAILARGVSDAADKWGATVANPDANVQQISGVVDAALDLVNAIAKQLGSPQEVEYSAEGLEAILLANRLLKISEVGNKRLLDSEPEKQVERRREQMRELTRRISA